MPGTMANNSSTDQSTGDVDELFLRSNLDFMSLMAPTLVYIVLLMTLGLVGNVLVLIVYYRRFKPSTTRTYILAMGVADLLSSSVALPSHIAEMRFYYNFPNDRLCKFFGGFAFFLANFGGCVLVAVALDRYRTVCGRGLGRRSLVYVRRELAFLCLFSVCTALPYVVLSGLQTIDLPGSDVKGHKCAVHDTYVGSLFFALYNGSYILAFCICVCIMSVSYGLIGHRIWQHRRKALFRDRHRQTSQACDREKEQKDSADASRDVRVVSEGVVESQTNSCENVAMVSSESQTTTTDTCSRQPRVLTLSRKEHSESETQQTVRAAKLNPNKKSVKKIPGRTTLMMFVLTATFVVSYLPTIVVAALFGGQHGLSQNGWVLNAQQITLRSYFINNAVNPFVFGFCSARFRQEVKAMWRRQ